MNPCDHAGVPVISEAGTLLGMRCLKCGADLPLPHAGKQGSGSRGQGSGVRKQGSAEPLPPAFYRPQQFSQPGRFCPCSICLGFQSGVRDQGLGIRG